MCEQLETSKELYLNVFILGIKHKPPWRTLAQRNLKSMQEPAYGNTRQRGKFSSQINTHTLSSLAARKMQAQAIVSGGNRTNRLVLKLSFM